MSAPKSASDGQIESDFVIKKSTKKQNSLTQELELAATFATQTFYEMLAFRGNCASLEEPLILLPKLPSPLVLESTTPNHSTP